MDVDGYVEFLKSQGLSVKGIATRKSKANDIEKITGKDLDIIVADDELMYQTILLLQGVDDSAHTKAKCFEKILYFYKWQRISKNL